MKISEESKNIKQKIDEDIKKNAILNVLGLPPEATEGEVFEAVFAPFKVVDRQAKIKELSPTVHIYMTEGDWLSGEKYVLYPDASRWRKPFKDDYEKDDVQTADLDKD